MADNLTMADIDALLSNPFYPEPPYHAALRNLKTMLQGWEAIQETLKDHALQGHIRGWNIEPIPEAVEAQTLWEATKGG